MKRFVYVPHQMQDDESLSEAKILSNQSRLQIMHGQKNDSIDSESICIIAIPVKQKFTYDHCVKSGFIHSIDIVDEFKRLDIGVKLFVETPSGKTIECTPRLKENHVLIFRNRFSEIGSYSFLCLNDNKELYYSGEFEVV